MTDQVQPELAPCPFCGGEAKWVEDTGAFGEPFGLVTEHRDICHLAGFLADKDQMITAWNTRALTSAPADDVEVDEERVGRWRKASAALGAWMSAALDDPKVCDAMKADIQEWFSAGEPFEGMCSTQPEQPAESAKVGEVCANCKGMLGDLAPGRDPEELCETCYGDALAALQPPQVDAPDHCADEVADLVKPWADFRGDLPDYDHPLRCVYESGVQYAVELLAKTLNVDDYDVCDGTEEFDGDLSGTMFNIVLAAMPKDEDGDPFHPRELTNLLQRLAPGADAIEQARRDERERAAAVAEEWRDDGVAAAIRLRGDSQ